MTAASRLALLGTVLLLTAAPPAAGAADAPASEPRVTTLISDHPGWVGGVTSDQLGYIYVADFLDKVWRLNPLTNELSLILSDRYGASGNTFDPSGNLYQSNFYGNTVDRISRAGEVTRLVSDGVNGPVGLTLDAEGNLYICSCRDQTVKKLTKDGELSTFAESPHFRCPNGITLDDKGDFYVVSFSSPKIIRVSPDGETSVFADTGGNGVGHITFLRGRFFATSYADNKVYRVSRDGQVEHFAGTGERRVEDGAALAASFSNPNGIAADPSGTFLYINDYVGDLTAVGVLSTPFAIRRIELPRIGRQFSRALDAGSPADAEAAYRAFKANPANTGDETEAETIGLAWQYMSQSRSDAAMLLFRLTTESYPESANAWGNLGAAYQRLGEVDSAVDAYERSLALKPENPLVIQRLEQIRGEKTGNE